MVGVRVSVSQGGGRAWPPIMQQSGAIAVETKMEERTKISGFETILKSGRQDQTKTEKEGAADEYLRRDA